LSKGVIFTLDATIALAIFLASLVLFYSFFTTETAFGLRGAAIYTKSENFLFVEDLAETFSSVVNLKQSGQDAVADQLFELIRSQSEFPANLKLYMFEVDNTTTTMLDNSPNVFEESLLFRRYTVFTLTRGIPEAGTDVDVNASTTTVNRSMIVQVGVTNSGGTTASSVLVELLVLNLTDDLMSWTITPPSQTIASIAPGATETVSFSVFIPEATVIDEYAARAVVGAPINQNGTDPFNVVRFGLVEMEVGI
jgi:hypothetical protein